MEKCNNCPNKEPCLQLLEDIKKIKANLYICLSANRWEKVNWYQWEYTAKYKELTEKLSCLDALRLTGECFKS